MTSTPPTSPFAQAQSKAVSLLPNLKPEDLIIQRGVGLVRIVGIGHIPIGDYTIDGIQTLPVQGATTVLTTKVKEMADFAARFRLPTDSPEDWAKIFALLLQGKPRKVSQGQGGKAAQRYDDIVKASDAFALAEMIGELRDSFAIVKRSTSHGLPYHPAATKALSILAQELSYVAKIDRDEAINHITGVLNDPDKNPMSIFGVKTDLPQVGGKRRGRPPKPKP